MDRNALTNLWATRNGRTNQRMTYRDLARTMRYHYKKSKGQELQAVNRYSNTLLGSGSEWQTTRRRF